MVKAEWTWRGCRGGFYIHPGDESASGIRVLSVARVWECNCWVKTTHSPGWHQCPLRKGSECGARCQVQWLQQLHGAATPLQSTGIGCVMCPPGEIQLFWVQLSRTQAMVSLTPLGSAAFLLRPAWSQCCMWIQGMGLSNGLLGNLLVSLTLQTTARKKAGICFAKIHRLPLRILSVPWFDRILSTLLCKKLYNFWFLIPQNGRSKQGISKQASGY